MEVRGLNRSATTAPFQIISDFLTDALTPLMEEKCMYLICIHVLLPIHMYTCDNHEMIQVNFPK